MGALNLPSASDLERLTRRLRGVSQRLRASRMRLDRLEQRVEDAGSDTQIDRRLAAIEEQLTRVEAALTEAEADGVAPSATSARPSAPRRQLAEPVLGIPQRVLVDSPAARQDQVARRSAGSPPRPRARRRARTASRSPSRPRRRRRLASPARRPGAGRRTDRWRPRARPGRRHRRRHGDGRAARRWPGPGSRTPSARLVPSAAIAPVATSSSPSARDPSMRSAGPDPDDAARSELDQLGDHDRGARPAHPGALDRERPAVRAAPVYPHKPRLWLNIFGSCEQRLGEQQRAPGIAGKEHPRREPAVGWRWIVPGTPARLVGGTPVRPRAGEDRLRAARCDVPLRLTAR